MKTTEKTINKSSLGIDQQNMVDLLSLQGLIAYARHCTASWLYYTDGENIGYWESGNKFSTVHMPNSATGTGFAVMPSGVFGSAEYFKSAFCFAPEWASARDRESVKKFASMQKFLDASEWNAGNKKVI